MKKLILLFLLTFASLQGQTRSDIQTQIDAIATGVPNTALKVRTVLNTIANGTAQRGDVKEIDVTNAYIAANFDSTGLGINERVGWAICNGNNGTRDRSGRVAIAYGTGYTLMGDTGGSPDAVVVSHVHYTVSNGAVQGNFDTSKKYIGKDRNSGTNVEYNLQGTVVVPTLGETTLSGVDGTAMNMQPFIVTLFIQKL